MSTGTATEVPARATPSADAIRLTVQIHRGDEQALGPERAALLAAIEKTGSISAAARALGVSYRYAWLLSDALNHAFRERLIDAAAGGRRGGGARLTPTGQAVLANYLELEDFLHAPTGCAALDRLRAMLGPATPKA